MTCFKLLNLSATGEAMRVALRRGWITKPNDAATYVFSLVPNNILELKLGFTLDEPQLWVNGIKCRKFD